MANCQPGAVVFNNNYKAFICLDMNYVLNEDVCLFFVTYVFI